MAPGLKRWGGFTLAACGAVALAYLPPRGAKAERGRLAFTAQLLSQSPARLRAQELAAEWRAAQAAVRLTEQREGLRGSISRLTRGADRPVVVLAGAGALPPAVLARLEANLDSVWKALGLGETKVTVAVVLDLGTPPLAGGPVEESGIPAYLLPHGADRTVCLVRIPASPYWRRDIREQQRQVPDARFRDWMRSALGPCAFFAAFGAPGRPVRGWLGRRQFDLAALAVWDAPPGSPETGDPIVMWAGSPWWFEYVYSQPPSAVACLAGRESACRDAVLAGAVPERWGDSLSPVLTQDRSWWRRHRLFGASRFLADVAREVGAERFQEFWSSTLPVDSSLALALRQPVGRWTAAWQRRAGVNLRLGPAPPLGAALLASLLGVGAVAIVTLASRRRQVR